MPEPRVTVVVPTLTAGPVLLDCVLSLAGQTLRDFEVVIVDNSGRQEVRRSGAARFGAVVIENERNVGFGAAVNAAYRRSRAPYLATLNDDAAAHPEWLCALVSAMETDPEAGMCASQIRLAGEDRLDSAGMLIAADGSSKQRGQGERPDKYSRREEVLFPSGAAALYRRAMLEQIGLFDDDFFLYCEDTDLGLRARWAGWKCLYVPEAVVEHHYSLSAGQASPRKAFYVERNRLFMVVKNFPSRRMVWAPFSTLARYGWHFLAMLRGRGAAGRFARDGHSPLQLVAIVVRAHLALLARWPSLWAKRRAIRRTARISPREFCRLLDQHSISLRQVAAL